MPFYSKWTRKVVSQEAQKEFPNEQIEMVRAREALDATMNDGSGKPIAKQASDRIKNLDLIFVAMERIARLGFLLTYEQSVVIRAMIQSQVPRILGDALVAYIGELMKKYKMTSFRKVIAVRFGRRRGKSRAIGYFHAIMMATQPEFHGMIINLDQDLASQNLKYAAEFVQMLQDDPEHVINCRISHINQNKLIVRSHHGTYNSILSTPNIEHSQGKVSYIFIFFYFCSRSFSAFFP